MRLHKSKLIAAIATLACLGVFAVFFAVSYQNPAAESGEVAKALAPESAESAGSASALSAVSLSEEAASPTAAPGDDVKTYAPGYVLATLADGVTDDEATQALAATAGLSGAAIEEHVEGSLVKVALPDGLAVERAVDLFDQVAAFDSAQPNYRYYIQETANPDAATAKLAQTAASATAKLVTGTALGNALPIQAAAPNDPGYVLQWALEDVNALQAWDLVTANTKAASAVTVAIIDNGFLINHEDLKDHIVDSYNAAAGSTTIGLDNSSHGTHVAGIVSAVTNNQKGVASVGNNALGLMLIRASDSNGNIDTDTIVKAYGYIMKNASAHNVRVVNMSLGAPSDLPVSRSTDAALYDAIGKARSAGIITVVAACNSESGYRPPFYAFPSDFDNVVSVINLEQSRNADGVVRDSTSNYNARLQRAKNISAPGTDIYSTYNGVTSYGYESGTSMSSPLVAGVLGLMFTVNPGLSASSAETLLYQSAKDLTASPASKGWDRYTGYGEVDVAAALKAAGAVEPAAPSTTIDIATCKVTVADAIYTGKSVQPAVEVGGDSSVLTRNVDYTVEFRDNVNAGTATYTVKGTGNYGGVSMGTFSISKAPISKVALNAYSAKYNGKDHKPAISSVSISSGTISSANYSVSYLRKSANTSNFKSVGAITVKVTGKNNCSGTITKTFTIKPKATSISKVKPLSKGLAVSWTKRATQTTGYQIRLATDSAFTKNLKTVTVGKASTTSKNIKSLKASKKYYVKVRTYKTVKGTRYYSSWSSVKTAKTKK